MLFLEMSLVKTAEIIWIFNFHPCHLMLQRIESERKNRVFAQTEISRIYPRSSRKYNIRDSSIWGGNLKFEGGKSPNPGVPPGYFRLRKHSNSILIYLISFSFYISLHFALRILILFDIFFHSQILFIYWRICYLHVFHWLRYWRMWCSVSLFFLLLYMS